MRSFVAVLLILCLASPAAALLETGQVMYVGGTIPNLKEGAMGRLDTAQEQALIFEHAGGRVEIPYAAMLSFNYEEKVAHRMGALPTIAVVLVKRRKRRHFVEITFNNANGIPQAAVFEISKELVQPVVAILGARCKPPKPDRPAPPRPS